MKHITMGIYRSCGVCGPCNAKFGDKVVWCSRRHFTGAEVKVGFYFDFNTNFMEDFGRYLHGVVW